MFGSESNPHYIKGSLILPNRVLIKPKIVYEKVVDEWRSVSKSAFGRFTSGLDLRSVFYKKVLGRGKSITHLYPEEEAKLAELLHDVSGGKTVIPNTEPYVPKSMKPIRFDLYPTSNGEVKYEKILEGWLIQNLDKPQSGTGSFLGNIEEIEWFGNYVPVSIAGGNLDILVFHKKNETNERCAVTIIELKKGAISAQDIEQLRSYTSWAKENLTFFLKELNSETVIKRRAGLQEVRSVIIGKRIGPAVLARLSKRVEGGFAPRVLTYDLDPKCYRIYFTDVSY